MPASLRPVRCFEIARMADRRFFSLIGGERRVRTMVCLYWLDSSQITVGIIGLFVVAACDAGLRPPAALGRRPESMSVELC
jgi:hypothetical protein